MSILIYNINTFFVMSEKKKHTMNVHGVLCIIHSVFCLSCH